MFQSRDDRQRLEKILMRLIEKYDSSRLVEDNSGQEYQVWPGEPGWEEGRARQSHELSLAQLTRKLFVDYSTRDMKTDLKLSDDEKEAIVYFTRKRKEAGAFWTGLLMYELIRAYSSKSEQGMPFHEYWHSQQIGKESDFLTTFVTKVMRGTKRLFDSKRTMEYKGTEYSSSDVLYDFLQGMHGTGEKNVNYRVKRIMAESARVPYHMVMHWRDSIPNNRNHLSLVFGRVKESLSENQKQAKYWAHDLDERARIEMLFQFMGEEEVPRLQLQAFREALEYANRLRGEDPLGSAHANRYDEVAHKWYYGIEDSYGITGAFARELSNQEIDGIRRFFEHHQLFDLVPGSEDDHRSNPKKPQEYQFKVRLNKDWLEMALPRDLFEDYYMPDTIEVQLTSLPDMVHKYLTPGLAERDYKPRRDKEKLQVSDHHPAYLRIFNALQSISPVRGSARDHARHVDTLMENLSYTGRTSIDPNRLDTSSIALNLLRTGLIHY